MLNRNDHTPSDSTPFQFAVLRALPGRDVLLVAVGVVLTDGAGKVLLHRQDDGRWHLPGGHVNPGEALEDAARRETREETGLTPLNLTLWTVVSGPGAFVERGGRRAYYVTMLFRATRHEGTLTVGDESTDVGWFDLHALPHERSATVVTVAHALLTGICVPVLTTAT